MYEIFEKLLQKFGVTAYQVSKATGISQSTLSSWKTRGNVISGDKLQKIANYFGVSIDYMLGNNPPENNAYSIEEDFKDLIAAYKNNPDMQPAVNKLLGLEYKKEM